MAVLTTCDQCGKTLEMGEWPFCKDGVGHGFPLAGLAIIDDELEGGPRRFETLGDDEPYIASKSQWKREVAARGLIHVDKHDRDYYRRKFKEHDERLRDTGRAE